MYKRQTPPSLVVSAVGSEARDPISPVPSWEGDGTEPSSETDQRPLLQRSRHSNTGQDPPVAPAIRVGGTEPTDEPPLALAIRARGNTIVIPVTESTRMRRRILANRKSLTSSDEPHVAPHSLVNERFQPTDRNKHNRKGRKLPPLFKTRTTTVQTASSHRGQDPLPAHSELRAFSPDNETPPSPCILESPPTEDLLTLPYHLFRRPLVLEGSGYRLWIHGSRSVASVEIRPSHPLGDLTRWLQQSGVRLGCSAFIP